MFVKCLDYANAPGSDKVKDGYLRTKVIVKVIDLDVIYKASISRLSMLHMKPQSLMVQQL